MGSHRAAGRGSRRSASVHPVVPAKAPSRAAAGAGKRRASTHAGSRGSLFKLLPSTPVLAGVATLAVAVGGALATGSTATVTPSAATISQFAQASAMGGTSGVASASLLANRDTGVSRDSQREGVATSKVEVKAKQRDKALQQFQKAANAQDAKIALNLWVLPVASYDITNTYGAARSYYSSGYHTGLDFNADSGDPIVAIANGVITATGYDGAFGNKTVLTLEDGTEIWFCHQSSIVASVGDEVHSGELIGYVGETGHAYGSHLHLEYHPGGGDAADPYEAFVQHGVTP